MWAAGTWIAGIGIGKPSEIGRERIVAFGSGQEIPEGCEKLGAKCLRPVDEGPFDLSPRAEEDGAQDEARDAVGMLLGIGERQRRAPRAADNEPLRRC